MDEREPTVRPPRSVTPWHAATATAAALGLVVALLALTSALLGAVGGVALGLFVAVAVSIAYLRRAPLRRTRRAAAVWAGTGSVVAGAVSLGVLALLGSTAGPALAVVAGVLVAWTALEALVDPIAALVPGNDVPPGHWTTRTPPDPTTEARPRLIGHRGCAGLSPENTIAAVEAAAPHVSMVEVDVRRCGTGELVVVHDETLDRVTDGTGRVDETPLAALQSLRVLGTNESIPTLRDLLAAVPDDVGVNVELKDPDAAEDAVEALAAVENDVLVSAFTPATLERVREADPAVPLAFITDRDPESAVETALALDCEALHPSVALALATDLVAAAHRAGLRVNVWTVDTAWTARRLAARRVDGLIVDDWTVLDAD